MSFENGEATSARPYGATTMFYDQLGDAIPKATTHAALDELARLTWRGLAEGLLDEEQAAFAGEAVEARRTLFRDGSAFRTVKAASAPRKLPRSPDKQRSIERRRSIAASGALPPRLACQFTTSEAAVLTVVAREVQRAGQCVLFLDAIAAMAGVSRSTAKTAIRLAARAGLISVEERRNSGRRSDTNVVRVISAEWRLWLDRGPGRHRGQKTNFHEIRRYSKAENSPAIREGSHRLARSKKAENNSDAPRIDAHGARWPSSAYQNAEVN